MDEIKPSIPCDYCGDPNAIRFYKFSMESMFQKPLQICQKCIDAAALKDSGRKE